MIFWLKKLYFQILIKLLVIFKPTVLFHKINQLDWYKSTLREWVDDQKLIDKSKVLEVGCATGALTTYISRSGCIPTGVDFSSNMIELAKINNSEINFSVADVLDLPFEENYFDGVIAASLINIVTEKSKAIGELYRVSKKGGLITTLVPLAEFDDEKLYSLQADLGLSGFSAAAMEAWHKRAPKMKTDEIIDLFMKVGLTEITTKYYLQGMVVSVSGIRFLHIKK